jgi:FkbM family methyltransferase
MISYAQNFEDVMLWRALGHIERGCYLDIGAQDPELDSVSKAFYDAGWRGVHVEATPHYAAAIRTARPDEIVIQAAVSDEAGSISFFEIPETGLSTGRKDIAETHEGIGWTTNRIDVPCVTLASVLTSMARRDIHWMKVDVEGMEANVLRSWGDCPIRPWVLVIESTFPNTQIRTQNEWIDLVIGRGYTEAWFDGLSRFFVAEDHQDLLAALDRPANVFDGAQVGRRHFAVQALMRDTDAIRADVEMQRDQALDDQRRGEEEAGSLRQVLEVRQSEIAERDERLAQSERYAESLAKRVTELEPALHAALDDQRRGEDEARSLRQVLEVRQTEIVERDKRLAQSEQHGESLAKRVTDLERELDAARVAARADLNKLRRDMDAAAVHHGNLLAAAGLERDQARSAVSQAQERLVAALESHQHKLDHMWHDHQARMDQHRAERGLVEASLAEAQASLAAVRAELAITSEQMGARIALLEQLRHEVQAREGELSARLHRADSALMFARGLVAQRWSARLRRWLGVSPSVIEQALQLPIPPSTIVPADGQPIPMSSTEVPVMVSTDNPYLRANSLAELCEWHDRDFVRCAYVTLLGRQPDMAGEADYVRRLRSGVHKLTIIRDLRRSDEGQSHDPGIAGLDKALRRHRNATRPVVGALVRLVTGREGNSVVETRLRMLANDVGSLRGEMRRGFAELAGRVDWNAERAVTMGSDADADQVPPPHDIVEGKSVYDPSRLTPRAKSIYARLTQ